MIRFCLKCGKDIGHLHGLKKYCGVFCKSGPTNLFPSKTCGGCGKEFKASHGNLLYCGPPNAVVRALPPETLPPVITLRIQNNSIGVVHCPTPPLCSILLCPPWGMLPLFFLELPRYVITSFHLIDALPTCLPSLSCQPHRTQ